MQWTKTSLSPARPRLALFSLVLGIAMSFGACNCDPVDVADGGSTSTNDDAGRTTGDDGGQICDLGTDNCDCRADDTCDEDLACTNGTCDTCAWGSTGCPCNTGSVCDGELVCDNTSEECRAQTGCESVGCAQYQLCRQEAGEDAACINECETGYQWIGTACEAVPSCDSAEPGYLDCGENRLCNDQGVTAECGDCEAGFLDLDEDGIGDCVENSCENICGAGRQCEEADGGLPICGDCEAGFIYDETTDTCIDRDTCSEIPACDTNTQVCQEATTTADAECIDVASCPVGQGDDGSGTCVRCDECYLFDGANVTPKTGVTGLGNNGAFSNDICVCRLADGYFQSHNDGKVKPCDADGDGWVNADYASMRAQGENSAFTLESRCSLRTVEMITLVSDDTGAGLAASQGLAVEDIAAKYALETAASNINSTIKRSPAQVYYVELLEPEVLDDISEFNGRYGSGISPKLRLYPYGGFVGSTLSVPDAGVAMSDGGIIGGASDGGAASPADAGTGVSAVELEIHKFHASEVNPMTKACNFDKDDLNYDGIADVLQSQDTAEFDIESPSGEVVTHSIAAVNFVATEFFYRMSYYTELDVGFFRPFAGECTTVGGSCRGEYIIAERSRVLGPAAMNGILFEYPSDVDNYWQTCMRGRDPNYPGDDAANLGVNFDFGAWYDFCETDTAACRYNDGTSSRIPYDGRSFADFSDGSLPREGVVHGLPADSQEGVDGGVRISIFAGMNHHSQFKCIAKSTLTGSNQGNRALASSITGDVYAQDCRLEPHTQNGGIEGDANPSVPSLLCTIDAADPGNTAYQVEGYNYWMALGQQEYTADSPVGYQGGCIDEGREWGATGNDPFLCLVQNENQAAENFGQLFCGCGTNRSGVDCEIGCPDQNLFSNRQAVDGELVGYWMCARPSATEGVTLRSDPVADGGVQSGYVLRGEIPAVAMPTEVLNDGQINDAGVATGYTLRPYLID